MNSARKDFPIFCRFTLIYCKRKVVFAATHFEAYKNWQVERLMFRRGVLQKRVWHTSMVGLSAFGIITSGVFGNQTIISASFPGVAADDPRYANTFTMGEGEPVLNSLYDTRTNISQKPRSEIITYEVQSGDTLSEIANKFGISTNTIKWANSMEDVSTIKPGEKLKILPVSGVSHTVVSGDTLASVAKKYSANQQAILDFPFNDIPNDFSLKVGQVLIIPDGTPPEAPAPAPPPQPQYLAQGPSSSPVFSAPGGGNFIWPVQGLITQYFSWYHPAIDIANPSGPLVVAAAAGTVVHAGWDNTGYGNMVMIDHGNGYKTLYAHFANIYVNLGQQVTQGEVIGRMGSTGRSTGTHTHFEIHFKGIALNPLSILK